MMTRDVFRSLDHLSGDVVSGVQGPSDVPGTSGRRQTVDSRNCSFLLCCSIWLHTLSHVGRPQQAVPHRTTITLTRLNESSHRGRRLVPGHTVRPCRPSSHSPRGHPTRHVSPTTLRQTRRRRQTPESYRSTPPAIPHTTGIRLPTHHFPSHGYNLHIHYRHTLPTHKCHLSPSQGKLQVTSHSTTTT